MKHTLRITIILISMFLVAQLIGIYVANAYTPDSAPGKGGDPNVPLNRSEYKLPEPFTPPENTKPADATFIILIALIIAVALMFILMKLKAETFLRIWFLIVVIMGMALAINTFLPIPNSAVIATLIAIPFGIIKIFKRNIIVHNFTELLIYPGIAAVFIPLLSIWTVVLLLIIISLYDMYAVWHSGFMQKMAKYQIEQVKVFSGFFVPYMGRKERERLRKAQKSKSKKPIRAKVNLAILGGGDVVFPMMLSGVVLASLGLIQAVIIAIGATLALAYLFSRSKKGKFYPAMPFITTGCLIALLIAYLI